MLNTRELINQNSLEGSGTFVQDSSVDVSVLKQAHQHHVDLDSLEDFTTVLEKQDEMPIKKASSFCDEWMTLDVRLGEMADSVFEASGNVIIIVCDDNVVYFNKRARIVLGLDDFKSGIGEKFLSFVEQNDWALLTDNIGDMLMSKKVVDIHLRAVNNKIVPMAFSAVYLTDSSHFSFILVGQDVSKPEQFKLNGLYDELTSLPTFFLFEDRLQVAINTENSKEDSDVKRKMAVVALNIDNLSLFQQLNLADLMYKMLSHQLVLTLKKNSTIARGLKYSFWMLLPDVTDEKEVIGEIEKIKTVLNVGIADKFIHYELKYSLGISLYPQTALSAKKLIQQTISALKQAQKQGENRVVFFEDK